MLGKDFWEKIGGLVDAPTMDKHGKPKMDDDDKPVTHKVLGD